MSATGRRSRGSRGGTRPADRGASEGRIPQASSQGGSNRFTVEAGAYAAILLVAAALRFWGLGQLPLAPAEAANAWESHSLFRWGAAEMVAGPLYVYGTALLLAVFGGDDTVPRLLPALLGTAMVGFPYLIRRQLGREASLFASGFLAVSPSLVFFSRYAGPEILAAALSSLVVLATVRYVHERQSWQLVVGASSLGLLLANGSLGYFSITAALLGLTLWVVLPARADGVSGRIGDRLAALTAWALREGRRAALPLAGVSVLVATGAGSDPAGLQRGLIDPLQGWIVGFFSVSAQPGHLFLQSLAVYEIGVVLLALGSMTLTMRGGGLSFWLTVWAFLAVILATLGGFKTAGLIAQIVTPLAFLAGSSAASVVHKVMVHALGRQLGVFMLTILPLLVLLYIVISHLTLPNPKVPAYFLAAPMVALSMVLLSWVHQVSWHRSQYLIAALLVGLTGLWGLSTSVNLSHPISERIVPLLAERSVSADLRALGQQTADISNVLKLRGESASIALHPGLESAVAWHLKDETDLRMGAWKDASIVVLPVSEPVPEGYVGQRYRLYYTWAPGDVDWRAVWRWVVLQESPPTWAPHDAMLCVRVN